MADVERIKEKLDIADFISGYVKLLPAGKNLKGLCPFHKEKTPSFIVSRDRQSWHCFGCGLGGDLISFLMQYENLEFLEALKILADKAGVRLEIGTSQDQRQYNVLYDINKAAKDIYKENLKSPNGKTAYDYLISRGLKPETVKQFELGLSGSQNDSLIKSLTQKGFSVLEIEKAGLAFKTERGTYWDRFRHRIMFPIANHFDKTVGFTGRILPEHDSDKVGKYVNSPETPIFNKSKLLFGFSLAKNVIREKNSAVLVEGQMDLIMLHQDGVINAVASSGTALTGEHAKTLRRFTENIVIAFDNDKAGKLAAERAIDILEAGDFNVKILQTPEADGKDPADVAKAHPGKMKELIAKAISAMEYYFDYFGLARAKDIAEKKKSIRQILAKIKQISSPIAQSHWLGELAVRTGLSQDVLSAEMAVIKINSLTGKPEEKPEEMRQTFSRLEIIIQRLIGLGGLKKSLSSDVKKLMPRFPEIYKRLFAVILSENEGSKDSSPSVQNDFLLSPGESQLLNLIQLRMSLEPIDNENLEAEIKLLAQEFEKEWLKQKRQELQQRIQVLEKSNDQKSLQKALEEYQKSSSI